MVVICEPTTEPAGVTQERLAWPLTCTVQAPHSEMPQPYFVPVMPILSRSTHSSGVSGVTSTLLFLPFTLSVIMTPTSLGLLGIVTGVHRRAACRASARGLPIT